MTKPASEGLKKTLTLFVLEREFQVEINFRIVDVIERAFDRSADAVLMMFAQNNIGSIRRGQIADVIASWLLESGADVKVRDVREYVLTSPAEQIAPFYGQVMAALLYATRAIDSAGFDTLVSSDAFQRVEGLKKKSSDGVSASSRLPSDGASPRPPQASASPPESSGA